MAFNLQSVFKPTNVANATTHRVYTRESWNAEWTLQPYLRCNWASAMLAPGSSAAELSWGYGEGKQADQRLFDIFPADTGLRRYVKIVFDTLNQQIAWHGIYHGMGTRHGGVRPYTTQAGTISIEQGRQVIQCVGLEKLFFNTKVLNAAWYDYKTGGIFFIDRGLTFNAKRADGTPGLNMAVVGGTPMFSGKVLDDDQAWTLDKCLQYLVYYHPPRDRLGNKRVPVKLAGLELLKTTVDRPHVPTHGRSVREILNQLLPHQRFLTYGIGVDAETNEVVIQLVTLTGEDLSLPSGDFILANPRRWLWDTDTARGTTVESVLSEAEAVDQVRMQGHRATSTWTASYQYGTLTKGWSAAMQTLYNNGANGTAAYTAAAGNPDRRRKLNAIARGADALAPVYSRLIIPTDFDGYTFRSPGGGGLFYFDPTVTHTNPYKFYQRELFIEPELPLRDGYDYTAVSLSGAALPAIKISEGPHNCLPPLVVAEVPASGSDASVDATTPKYCQIEKIALARKITRVPGDPSRHWSAGVQIPANDRAIVLNVSGGPGQHVLAGSDFTKRPEDAIVNEIWDWRKVYATICTQLDSYCEGVWPPNEALPNSDYIRVEVIQAPDTFRLDWLVPNTIVGVNADGTLKRETLGRWVNDDRQKLVDRAGVAFEWYGRTRRAVRLTSGRINGTIRLGDFVSQLGVDVPKTVNTVITEVRIDCPPDSDEPPRVTYTTDYVHDLDLYLSPNLGSGARQRGDVNMLNRKARRDFAHELT